MIGEYLATISKKLTFDSAHYLVNESWSREDNIKRFHKCCLYKEDGTEEPHGHTYHMEVFVTGMISDETGYVIDFKDLKKILKEGVERIDHRLINNIPWFKGKLTTVENILHYMWEVFMPKIDNIRPGRAWLAKIEIYETPNSRASFDRKQWNTEQLKSKQNPLKKHRRPTVYSKKTIDQLREDGGI